jgi:hypothetical protein
LLCCLRPMILLVLPWFWSSNILDKFSFTKDSSLIRTRALICKFVFKLTNWLCHEMIMTQPSYLMALILTMCYERHFNVPFQMTKWLVDYIMHQSNLLKLEFISVSHGRRNPAKEGKCERISSYNATTISNNILKSNNNNL